MNQRQIDFVRIAVTSMCWVTIMYGCFSTSGFALDAPSGRQTKMTANEIRHQFQSALELLDAGDAATAISVLQRLNQQSSNGRIKLELARAHLMAGNLEESESLLKEVLAGNPPENIARDIKSTLERIESSKTNVAYFKDAMEFLNKGDAVSAIGILEWLYRENQTGRIKAELAKAYLMAGDMARSDALFREVLAENPPENVARNISAFLEAIGTVRAMAVRGSLPQGKSYGHSFHGKISNGIMWDSNPKASPNSLLIDTVIGELTLDPNSIPRSSWAEVMQAELHYTYKFRNSPFALKANAFYYAPHYFSQHDQDYQYISLRSGFSYENRRFGFDMLGRFSYLEKDKRSDLRSWGYETNFRYLASNSLLLLAGWRHDIKDRFKHWFRNGKNDNVYIGAMWLMNKRHRISLHAGPEWERAHYDQESYNSYWLYARYDLALPHDFSPYISYRYKHSEYRAPEWIFNRTRRDNLHEAVVGVNKTWWKSKDKRYSLSSDLSYTYTRSYSNIKLYDYKRHAVQFDVSFGF